MSAVITAAQFERATQAHSRAAVPGPLAERAARLWPDSERNQREWIRAVIVVRQSSNGWLLDKPKRRTA